jgi:hypothetical protein
MANLCAEYTDRYLVVTTRWRYCAGDRTSSTPHAPNAMQTYVVACYLPVLTAHQSRCGAKQDMRTNRAVHEHMFPLVGGDLLKPPHTVVQIQRTARISYVPCSPVVPKQADTLSKSQLLQR